MRHVAVHTEASAEAEAAAMKKRAWCNFEVLFQHIQQQMATDAVVSHNQFIVGKSGVRNQCDVVIRGDIGQYPFLIIVECQDRSKKIGLSFVREVQSKKTDIGAHRAVIVNRLGFTRDALKFSKHYEIEAYTLADANSRNWREVGALPFLLTVLRPKKTSVALFSEDRISLVRIRSPDGSDINPEHYTLKCYRTGERLSLRQVAEEHWNRIAPTLADTNTEKTLELFTNAGEYGLIDASGINPILVRLKYVIDSEYRYGHLTLATGHRLIDVLKNRSISDKFTTRWTELGDIWNRWPSTRKRDEVPITPQVSLGLIGSIDNTGVPLEKLEFSISNEDST